MNDIPEWMRVAKREGDEREAQKRAEFSRHVWISLGSVVAVLALGLMLTFGARIIWEWVT